jgi:hypothetical protein
MFHLRQRRMLARTAGAAGLLLALGGCWSAPKGPTSAGTVAPVAGPVSVDAIAQRYIDGEKFKRISEYFDGVENKGGRIIERSKPDSRSGYYFIVDLNWHPGTVLPKGTRAVLEYIRSDTPTPTTQEYVFSEATGTWPEILLGLTGSDWPRPDLSIVAYRLTLFDPDGKKLTEHQSFLWSLPPTVGEPAKAAEAKPTPASTESNVTPTATTTPAPTAESTPVPIPSSIPAGGTR